MTGSLIADFSVRNENTSEATGVLRGAPLSFQSGISSLIAIGSITAPDKVWPPENQIEERSLKNIEGRADIVRI